MVEYMHLAGRLDLGEPIPAMKAYLSGCLDKLLDLELWEGDKIFLRLLSESGMISFGLAPYMTSDELIEACSMERRYDNTRLENN